jgi:hypothetical protein
LLFALPGEFALRFVAVQFSALLFQLPPRFTRFEPLDRSPLVKIGRAGGIANWKDLSS